MLIEISFGIFLYGAENGIVAKDCTRERSDGIKPNEINVFLSFVKHVVFNAERCEIVINVMKTVINEQ